MPSEIQRFQDDLLESVRQRLTGKAARVMQVKLSAAAEARAHGGLSQHEVRCRTGGLSAHAARLGTRAARAHGRGQDAARGCRCPCRGATQVAPRLTGAAHHPRPLRGGALQAQGHGLRISAHRDRRFRDRDRTFRPMMTAHFG
jgi:hypothetical protein